MNYREVAYLTELDKHIIQLYTEENLSQQKVADRLDITRNKLNTLRRNSPNVNNYSLKYGGNGIPYEILSKLYDNATVFLQRKHILFVRPV